MDAKKTAFIGLGVMGFPMAGHLARAGHHVTVYNRTPAKALQWTEKHGGKSAPTPAAAATAAEFVMLCVGNDDDVRSVALAPEGALSGMKAGAILIDHTTASATIAREVYAAAEPVLACYARAVTLLGGPGSGQLTKMVNQICVAGVVQALSEGINFGMRAGLDIERVLDVIGKGAAQSWQMDNRGKTMAADKFDFGFAVDWMRKDLSMAIAEARSNGAALPMTALIDQFYARIQARGGGRWDTSSLIRLLRDKA